MKFEPVTIEQPRLAIPVAVLVLGLVGLIVWINDYRARSYERLVETQLRLERLIPDNSVILMGDSIVANAPWNCPNLGIAGLRSDHLLTLLPRYRSASKARAVILSIGTNDIRYNRTKGFGERLSAILDQLPETYVLGVPMSDELNPEIRKRCTGRCHYIEPPKAGADGYHLAPEAYPMLAKLLPVCDLNPKG